MKALPKIILIFLSVDWPIFSRRPMARALATMAKEFGTTVVAVNRPLCPLSTLVRKPRRMSEFLHAPRLENVAENLWLFSPKYFVHDQIAGYARLLENLNLMALRRSYANLTAKLNIEERAPLIWYYDPQQGYVTRLFRDSFCIYEIYDSLTDMWGNPRPRSDRLEVKWRSRVDLLLTTSRKLFDKYSPYYRNAVPFGNGLDKESFAKYLDENIRPHTDILKIHGPRIGYAGNISERLDWKLIKSMAKSRPQWSFVFVGRTSGIPREAISRECANIHFMGEYSYEEIPAIVKAFDVGIMPYFDNQFYRHSNPLKFYELAAAGIRSISSRMDELYQFPSDFVRICQNQTEQWVAAIEEFLDHESADAHQVGAEIASRFLWEDMSMAVLRKATEMLDQKANG